MICEFTDSKEKRIMRKTVLIVLALLAIAQLEAAKPGPFSYAVALNTGANRFGTLDIGSGAFHTIANLPNGGQGIASDANGRIYVVDVNNNLATVNLGNGKVEVIGSTGVTTPGPAGPALVDVFASLATGE